MTFFCFLVYDSILQCVDYREKKYEPVHQIDMIAYAEKMYECVSTMVFIIKNVAHTRRVAESIDYSFQTYCYC